MIGKARTLQDDAFSFRWRDFLHTDDLKLERAWEEMCGVGST